MPMLACDLDNLPFKIRTLSLAIHWQRIGAGCAVRAQLQPAMLRRRRHNAPGYLVSDLSDGFDGLSFEIGQRPFEFFEAGKVGTSVTSPW